MKKTIIALFAGVALFAGLSSTADAKVHVRVYLGVPYYDYQVGPGYMYNDNYGWYNPGYRMPGYGMPGYGMGFSGRLSCGEARRLVRQRGFYNVRARECEGRTYTFIAMRNNHQILVFVNSRNGAVWRG